MSLTGKAMPVEYLLFNTIILLGPLTQSFDQRVRYVKRWPEAAAASLLSLIPFILWDAVVTGRHWRFNERFILGPRLLGLPIEEWLFFFSVPFACLFIWEIILTFLPPRRIVFYYPAAIILSATMGMVFFSTGKEYTGLVFSASAAIFLLDHLIKTRLLTDGRLLIMIVFTVILILIFNTYLTARPVVIYNPQYQLNFRIITIPVEDFLYGVGHILLTIIFYERFKAKRNG